MSANRPAGASPTSDSEALAAAKRSGRPFVVFRDRDGKQRLFQFALGPTSITVGRRSTSDLVLDWDDQVSRLHARFELDERGCALVDDGLSSNGTFVNEERVNGRRRLNDGDELRFGTTTLLFRAPAAEPPDRGTVPPPVPIDPPVQAPEVPKPPQDRARRPAAAVALSSTQLRVLAALCRPYRDRDSFATPAEDQEIAEELVLSVGEVRAHLQVLCAKLGVTEPPGPLARVRLVERAFAMGLISEADL